MILVIVFDGLRPDQITSLNTPNLFSLANRGVLFLNHHAAFPTQTRVNVATLFTGCYPGHHGILTNILYLPDLDPTWKISTAQQTTMSELDKRLGGKLVMSTTLGEALHANGKTMAVIGAGGSGNAFLHHVGAARMGGVVIHPDFTVPEPLGLELEERYGPWPTRDVPSHAIIERAVTIFLDYLLPTHQPDVAAMWLPDPDFTEHNRPVGSPVALEAIKGADAQLGRIVSHLEEAGLADSTDILVASDHGHSTISETVDVESLLIQADLKEGKSSIDVLVAHNGGCVSIYVPDHDRNRVGAIAELLMKQRWCGPVFAREAPQPVPGTLPLSLVYDQNPRSPDILMSFSWNGYPNGEGVRGTVVTAGGLPPGVGEHGSLSPYEIHNVLVAGGPHFKQGTISSVPSGNVDLSPTILRILGLESLQPMDGRALTEALSDGPEPEEVFVATRLHEASTTIGGTAYRQELQVSEVAGTRYLDKGRATRS